MPDIQLDGVRLYYEEHGSGSTILCIHGTSGSALTWRSAAAELSKLGRVVAYDRRGYTRSERSEPYRTSVAEHGDDAAALLGAVHGSPAVVVGRSYGGAVALDLALRHPEHILALAVLEPLAQGLDPEADAYSDQLRRRVEGAAAQDASTVPEVFLREVLGDEQWDGLPDALRESMAKDSMAILAEVRGPWLRISAEELGRIDVPVVVLAAETSPPVFRMLSERIASAIPRARLTLVDGGHLVDPAGPAVQAFIREVLAGTGDGTQG